MLLEQHVIGGIRVKGRVQVDQVHRLVFDLAPQDIQIVAVKEGVHGLSSAAVLCRFYIGVIEHARPLKSVLTPYRVSAAVPLPSHSQVACLRLTTGLTQSRSAGVCSLL